MGGLGCWGAGALGRDAGLEEGRAGGLGRRVGAWRGPRAEGGGDRDGFAGLLGRGKGGGVYGDWEGEGV